MWEEKSNTYRVSVGKPHVKTLCNSVRRKGKSVLSLNLQRLSHAFVMGVMSAAYLMLNLSQ